MVINMNEARLTTIEQIEQFLSASNALEFSAAGDEGERYVHIGGVLKRFDWTLTSSGSSPICSTRHPPAIRDLGA